MAALVQEELWQDNVEAAIPEAKEASASGSRFSERLTTYLADTIGKAAKDGEKGDHLAVFEVFNEEGSPQGCRPQSSSCCVSPCEQGRQEAFRVGVRNNSRCTVVLFLSPAPIDWEVVDITEGFVTASFDATYLVLEDEAIKVERKEIASGAVTHVELVPGDQVFCTVFGVHRTAEDDKVHLVLHKPNWAWAAGGVGDNVVHFELPADALY